MNIAQKAERFKRLHLDDDIFIMANAWNAGSAVLLEDSGFKAIGTTSAGIAYSQAIPDYAGLLPFKDALLETSKIAQISQLPVSMDAENGYGHSSEDIYNNMKLIAKTGVVGASIEDFSGDKSKPLYDVALAVERIKAAKQAVAELEYPFMITARAECYLTGHPNAFKESMHRLQKYQEAGADCLFVPGIKDAKTIKTFVQELDAPLSVVMGLKGKAISVAELQDLGVSRISIGGSLARATFGLVQQAAREILEHGTFNYSQQQMPDADLCALFSRKK